MEALETYLTQNSHHEAKLVVRIVLSQQDDLWDLQVTDDSGTIAHLQQPTSVALGDCLRALEQQLHAYLRRDRE